jgi:hypothetical protein
MAKQKRETTTESDLLDSIFLQPWFITQSTALQIRDCLPAELRSKMRYYFEDYGCLRCDGRGVAYGSNAMCRRCVAQTKLRFVFAIKRRWTANLHPTEKRPPAINRMSEAQRLLKDIANRRIPKRGAFKDLKNGNGTKVLQKLSR